MDKLIDLKKKYLFDERGMIRPGLLSMESYAKIMYAEDEEELDTIISELMNEKEVGVEKNET